jgi:membrane protein YdbS with pleckstrin-like domain
MEESPKIERLISHVKEYAEERFTLIILNVHEKVSKVLSKATSFVIFILLGVFTLVFLSLGLAWWISQQMNQPHIGFIIVGLLYLVVGFVIYAKRKEWIWDPISVAFLKNVIDEDED